MNNYKAKIKADLDGFLKYLTDVAKLSNNTANDYCKRIMAICNEENIELVDLSSNIEKYQHDYTVGDKKALGARSHNSFRGAINQFHKYLAWSKTQQQTTQQLGGYLIRLSTVVINNRRTGLLELIDQATNELINMRTLTKKQTPSQDDLWKVVWEMVFEVAIKNKDKMYEALKIQDIHFEVVNDITNTTSLLF